MLLHPVISMTAPGDSLELQQNQSVASSSISSSSSSLSLPCWLIFRSLSLQLPVRKHEASVSLRRSVTGLFTWNLRRSSSPQTAPLPGRRSNKSKWVHAELEFTREADVHESVFHPRSGRRRSLGSSPSPTYSIKKELWSY